VKSLRVPLACILAASFVLSCARVPSVFFRARSPITSLRAQLDTLFSDPRFSNAFWGVLIQSLDSGEILYARNQNKGFMPASNMKLFTTATALARLGADFRYETRIAYQGELDAAGTLHGDVIIIGSGDPSISGRYSRYLGTRFTTDDILDRWVDAFTSAGICKIEGNIIGDDDIFVDDAYGDTWEIGYIQDWYAAPSDGLSMNDNCYDLTITPAQIVGAPATIQILPLPSYNPVSDDVITTASGAKRFISFWRNPYGNAVSFKGLMPLGAKPYREFASVYNGTLYAATLLRNKLIQRGIAVSGEAKDIDDFPDKKSRFHPDRYQLIHSHFSPPISKIITIINKPSQNFYADMLLKTLGARFKGEGSFRKGADALRQFLGEIGVPAVQQFDMHDGSGLSRKNLVQPRQTVALLRHMMRRPDGMVFYDSLPIAGVDGTIRWRMRGTAAEGNVHAKTGYIDRARALSGYVFTRDREWLVFSMMANNYTVPTADVEAVQDRVCALLAGFSRAHWSPPPLQVAKPSLSEESLE
jgi:D-alanyl-D-alanine carboxypeptidase/D-alanyl-D-alanine-endopeptidase (penicillin-binding protein 4)